MKKFRLIALVLAVVMMLSVLTACWDKPDDPQTPPEENKELVYTPGTTLRMACGYNNANTAISFDSGTIEKYGTDGALTLSNGATYRTGDLKPTWAELEERLGIEFTDLFTGAGSATKEFNVWAEKLNEVDMVAGSATQLTENGVAGKLVNLADYLDYMPNFRAYLEANPIVRLSITGDTQTGAIYFSPYFDGVNDIERMPLMRTDWVEKLLNGEGDFTAEQSKNLAAAVYTPYMPTSGSVTVDAVNKEGTAVIQLTKNYDAAGNIVKVMNDALAAGTVTGVQAVNMLRDYIDTAYNGYYGNNRADLFIGQNAAWDADELVALLRCVVANSYTLNGTDTVHGLFARNTDEQKRKIDMFRFAGTLFGVRGLESRSDYLYVGTDGQLHDARQEEATYVALERFNAMTKEGLVSSAFVNSEDNETKYFLQDDLGFMHYDYNQTQTLYNGTKDLFSEGEKYMAVMIPVARWYDGTNANGVYMRFTESWRSVKTDGWALSKAGIGDDQNKLHAALKLIDYAYSEAGQILMSYGPDEFIKTNEDGSYVTFNFNGKQMPVIADSTYEELWDLAGGNYTNYARYFLGSTLSFVKSQAFEYQCTHAVGKEGAGHLSVAIGLGTIKHVELALTENPWYTSVPTVIPYTAEETASIKELSELTGDTGKFAQTNKNINIFVDLISFGYGAAPEGKTNNVPATSAAAVAKWAQDNGGKAYIATANDAYARLVAYYNRTNK